MPRPSLSSVVIKSVDEGEVRRRMDEHGVHLLASRPEVEEIIVFGSFENGSWSPGSDLDLFVVLARSSQPVWDRISSLMPRRFPVGVDLFP